MTVFVSILVLAAVLALIALVAHVLWRLLRLARPRNLHPTHGRHRLSDTPTPYGELPRLDAPVGSIDQPGPDADLSSDARSARDVYR